MGPRTTHGTDDDNPSEVLLVPPPVRPRRLPHRLPPVSDASAAATWLAEDAEAVPTEDGPPAREHSPVLRQSPRRLDSMPAAVPHRFREPSPSPPMRWGETPRPVPLAARENRLDHADASVFESIDDPLTLSSNDTVPLFGLAPAREVQPNPRPRPPVPTSARVAWAITALALLLTLAMALALLLF